MSIFSGTGIAQSVPDNPSIQQSTPGLKEGATSKELPHAPRGRSTVMGGEISDVDLVRDQFKLKIFGGNTVKILFDERTRVYRDGKQISVLTLKPEDHASVETTLDGTSIFALRIHMLTQIPEGEFRGQVVNFNPDDRELKMRSISSRELLTLLIPQGISIGHAGNGASAQAGGALGLVKGAIVDVNFKSGGQGNGLVTRISVVATPGESFVISGKLSVLDVHAGRMVVTDAGGGHTNEISFNPARFAVTPKLKEGAAVKVTSTFDGSRLTAVNIELEEQDTPPKAD